MLLRHRSAHCLSLLGIAALAGCGESQAHFADATHEQLERTYTAATGRDLALAYIFGRQFANENDTMSCPTIVTEGQDTTVTGGCRNENGARLDGSIVLHNLPSNLAYDPLQPTSIELDFEATSLTQARLAIDGHVELDDSRLSGDLTIDLDGITSTSRLTLACDLDEMCTASPGSNIEIAGLGSADVEGSWSLSLAPRGQAIVRGADVLVFDIASSDEDSCVPYTVGDNTGAVCVPGIETRQQALVRRVVPTRR